MRSMKRLAIVALSLATALTGVPPAEAFPVIPTPNAQVSEVQQVQYKGHNPRSWSGDSAMEQWLWFKRRGAYRNHDRWDGPRYGSYRRYRDRGYYRRHYRDWDDDDDDFGAALGGFAAGAIIGGLLSQPPRAYYRGGGNSHANWCYARYRSYRAYDNTYQPYYGRRRQCISPYM
ncbi:hypothetical protein M728_000790 [Ensifer sp. WSM1721]